MEQLEQYMLTNKRCNDLLYRTIEKKNKKKQNYIVKDELFWNFYKFKNINYEKYPSFEEENEIKYNLISNFDKKKDMFKQFKLKKEDVQEDIIYNKLISLIGFTALCLFYKLNIILVKDKCYFLIGVFDCTETNYHTLKIENDNYIFIKSNINNYVNYYKIPYIFKPLYAISNYKVSEIKQICTILDIYTDGTKKELYEKIKHKLTCLFNL